MTAHDHITFGSAVVKVLLTASVLTAGIGGMGTVTAEPIDGKGNDVIYGTGNHVVTYAFPIDNVSVGVHQTVPFGMSKPESHTRQYTDGTPLALALPQDMDPY